VRERGNLPFNFEIGHFVIRARIAALPIVEGVYTVGLWLVTDAFSGRLLELENFAVAAARTPSDFTPYEADHRGVVVLEAETAVIADQRPVSLRKARQRG
jgi:hypothetical protein